jgi:hypothetical protein
VVLSSSDSRGPGLFDHRRTLTGLSAPAAGAKRREKPSPPYGDEAAEGGGPALMCFAAGVERYKQSNKSSGRAEP